jgi:exodeoxyribonuclease VII large subunit
VEQFELSGVGEFLKLFEERKKKLAEQGFFDATTKKPIPFLPKLIGIITSPTGAVIKDMLHRIDHRFPRLVLLWPVLVQGLDAGRQITEAIDGMNNLPIDHRPDLIIVARGGGSLEDLMPFNEEDVVKAVARSIIPIISAVGHETDTTLIDYAADLRAPTPTAAAEFAVPERIKLRIDVDKVFSSITVSILGNLEKKRLFLNSAKILNVQGIMAEKTQKADYLFDKAFSKINELTSYKSLSLARIFLRKPLIKDESENLYGKLTFLFRTMFEATKNKLALLSNAIESNSYANILKKGFAFVESPKKVPITSAKAAGMYSTLHLVFADGKIKVKREPSQIDLFTD